MSELVKRERFVRKRPAQGVICSPDHQWYMIESCVNETMREVLHLNLCGLRAAPWSWPRRVNRAGRLPPTMWSVRECTDLLLPNTGLYGAPYFWNRYPEVAYTERAWWIAACNNA